MTLLSPDIVRRLRASLEDQLPYAKSLRREIHTHARVSGDEEDTLGRLLAALPIGGEVTRVAEHGAVVAYDGPGPVIGLRAEMDALPLEEHTGSPWAATNGAMHACGHDVHMAALVGVVRAMRSAGLPIVAILQPREETYPSGARDIVESGALAAVDAVIGVHVQPMIAAGYASTTPGAVNAAADEFVVVIRGREGHAAYPNLTRDPVIAAGHFVVAVQQIVSRNADPMVPAVLTIGAIHGGSASNAIPGEVTMRGTTRTMSESERRLIHIRLREVADGIALAHGCVAEVTIAHGEPVLVNDPGLCFRAREHLAAWGVGDAGEVRSCGADDFAHYGEHHPSLMMFVGVDAHGESLHSRAFLPDDTSVGDTARAMLAGVVAAMGGTTTRSTAEERTTAVARST